MSDKEVSMERFNGLSDYELRLLADAVWVRQRHHIAGDRKFKEYGALLDEIQKLVNYQPGVFL